MPNLLFIVTKENHNYLVKTIKTEPAVLGEHHNTEWKYYTIFPRASSGLLPILPLINQPKRKEHTAYAVIFTFYLNTKQI